MKKYTRIKPPKKNLKYGKCALCKKKRVLKLSHRIPKAVGAIIKKDSFTKRFRSVHDPNTPVQDLDKKYMLCGECEQRFSGKETLFIQKVLRPFRNNRSTNFEYDSWLHYFIISLSWRTMYDDVIDKVGFIGNGFSEKQYQKLVNVESLMRKYLLDKSHSVYNVENHLVFLEENTEIVGHEGISYSEFCNATFGYVFGNKNKGSLYIFHVLAGILVITVIQRDPIDNYKNTYVKNGKGKFTKGQRVQSDVVYSEVINYVSQQLAQAIEQLSEIEKQKLIKKIEKDPERFLKSSSSIKYRE